MVDFNSFTLQNGLRVFVHEDHDTQIAAVNILYDVGSRDEDENKTGFAHLFEHLMFGGSVNIPSYDEVLQNVGGENNAFTSSDITNYYLTLPANNLETGFWLESDRMLNLSLNSNVLEVQRNVVIEEFKQRYLNQPYGDAWLKLRPLAYKVHPYKWPTIGKDISHIEQAEMDDVKGFFNKFYNPTNAIMVVAGNVDSNEVESLSIKWFEPIPAGQKYSRSLPVEPFQNEERRLVYEADVPLDSIFKTYHMGARMDDDYLACDLLGDILGRGKSSRLYDELVKKKQMFNSIHAYVTGSFDPGLLVINGNLNPGYSLDQGDEAIQSNISDILSNGVESDELEKVKNQAEATIVFSEVELLNKAMNIAIGAAAGDPDLINKELEIIRSTDINSVVNSAQRILVSNNCSTLYYKANTNTKA